MSASARSKVSENSTTLGATATADPLSTTAAVGTARSLLATVSGPLCVPPTSGENRMVTACSAPAATVNGTAGAAAAKRGLLLVTLLTVSGAVPLLPTVKVRSLLSPAVKFPKSSVPGEIVILGVGV